MFHFSNTPLTWAIIIEPQIFWDERGFFMETYNEKEFQNAWINVHFVQDNHSKSKAWVLRWLHFQTINTQSKLVRVISGSVYDVAVDLRKGSKSYWKWFWVILSAENKKQFFIPKWFAHWFLTLEDNTEFVYKCDDFYNPEWDSWIAYNSPELNINWWEYFDEDKLIISEKDTKHQNFDEKRFYFWYRELTQNIYAYIDTQNIWQSLKSDWWLIDWKRFIRYLQDKFKVRKVYLFLWYVIENKDFYNNLKSWWYEIIFKETKKIWWKVKWNVDSELVLQVMKDIQKYNWVLLATSDGDFACLVDELKEKNKFFWIMPPNYKFCSYLLKERSEWKIYDICNIASRFSQKLETKK